METNLYVWPLFGVMVALLLFLGFAQAKLKSRQLWDTKTDLRTYAKAKPGTDKSLDEAAEQRLIQRHALLSALPFIFSTPIWMAWIVLYSIDPSTRFVLGVFIAAVFATGFCLGLFVSQLYVMRTLRRSHIGVQRH